MKPFLSLSLQNYTFHRRHVRLSCTRVLSARFMCEFGFDCQHRCPIGDSSVLPRTGTTSILGPIGHSKPLFNYVHHFSSSVLTPEGLWEDLSLWGTWLNSIFLRTVRNTPSQQVGYREAYEIADGLNPSTPLNFADHWAPFSEAMQLTAFSC